MANEDPQTITCRHGGDHPHICEAGDQVWEPLNALLGYVITDYRKLRYCDFCHDRVKRILASSHEPLREETEQAEAQ